MKNHSEESLYLATKKAFETITKNSTEQIYAFCLFTDSDWIGVNAAANTKEHFDVVLSNLDDDEKEYPQEFQWSFSEWKYDYLDNENFTAFFSAQIKKHDACNDFKAFKSDTYNAMLRVLKKLDQEGVFNKHSSRDDIVIYISTTNDEEAFDIENKSAEELNSNNIYEDFFNRYPE